MKPGFLDKFLFFTVFSVCAGSSVWGAEKITGQSTEHDCVKADANCREIGKWEASIAVGVGGRTNPLAGGDDQPIVVIPQISWYGKRFFLDNLDFGYTLVDKPQHMLNLLVQPGLEQIYFDKFGIGNFTVDGNPSSNAVLAYSQVDGSLVAAPADVLQAGTPSIRLDDIADRKTAIMGGAEYSFYSGNWQTQLQLLSDVSSVHEGKEVRLSGSYQIPGEKNLVSFAAGVNWQSEELLDYYYGVHQNDLPGIDFVYKVDAGVSVFTKISWERKLSEKWSWLSTFHYRQLDSALKNSPLVEKNSVVTVFTGGNYHF